MSDFGISGGVTAWLLSLMGVGIGTCVTLDSIRSLEASLRPEEGSCMWILA